MKRPKKSYYKSEGCISNFNCHRCRLMSQKGKEWREKICQKYAGVEGDFDCPKNKPWIYPVEKEKQPEGHKSDPRIEICEKCWRIKSGCPNIITGCCGGGYTIQITTQCPENKWY